MVPSTMSLLEAIKVRTKETNMIGKLRANVARRLAHVHSFSKIPMKKDNFNIKLTNNTILRKGNTQDGSNCGMFDDRTKCVIKVKTRLLEKTLSNKATFVMI